MVVIDSSVWIDHFKSKNEDLRRLIEMDLAGTHPMIIMEIACGTPPSPRSSILHMMSLLVCPNKASMDEIMDLIEREKLYGLGCGMVDITLLASTMMTPGAKLWTRDKRLLKLAIRFGIAFDPNNQIRIH